MTDSQIIQKIQTLKQIKPRKDWVVLTKSQIFGEASQERSFNWHWHIFPRFFFLKPVWVSASTLAVLVLFGVLGFAQMSLPGDYLYSVKKIGENSQMAFVSESGKTKAQLELANKRLQELEKIAKNNQSQKLAPAINEFQASTKIAAKNLDKITKVGQNPQMVKDILFQAQKLAEEKKKIETLGVVIGDTTELNTAMRDLVAREIEDLEKSTLTEKQQEVLTAAKADFEKADYAAALSQILLNLTDEK